MVVEIARGHEPAAGAAAAGGTPAEAEGGGSVRDGAGLRLEALGGLRLTRDGTALAGPTYAKSRALLAYLAITRRPHTREALASLLWGEMPDAAARQNLRVILGDLRRTAGGHLAIVRDT